MPTITDSWQTLLCCGCCALDTSILVKIIYICDSREWTPILWYYRMLLQGQQRQLWILACSHILKAKFRLSSNLHVITSFTKTSSNQVEGSSMKGGTSTTGRHLCTAISIKSQEIKVWRKTPPDKNEIHFPKSYVILCNTCKLLPNDFDVLWSAYLKLVVETSKIWNFDIGEILEFLHIESKC